MTYYHPNQTDAPTTTSTTAGMVVDPPPGYEPISDKERAYLLRMRRNTIERLRIIEDRLGMAHSVPARRERG